VFAIIDIAGIRKKKGPGKSGDTPTGAAFMTFWKSSPAGEFRRRRIRFRIPDLPNRPSSGKINRNYGDYG